MAKNQTNQTTYLFHCCKTLMDIFNLFFDFIVHSKTQKQ